MSSKYVASIFLLTSFWSPAFAEGGVPAQIRNKTITISFNATGNAKSPDGQVKGFSTQVSRIVYVSSTGRLFMRAMAKHGSNSRSGDFDPKDARSGKGIFNFQGARLVGVVPFSAGARQITVTFDPGFSSCTVSVIEGHSSGGTIRRMGPDGIMYEISSASTSSPSCSIQNGNAFASQ
jgi:hypothetical protein